MDVIIGIGNRLRGDDGVGPHVVDALMPRSDLETMTVHQLVPELSEQIHAAERVLFVDACIDRDAIALTPIAPSEHRGLGHACAPGALLSWTQLVFGEIPDAWLLRIPGADFDLGERLSQRTQRLLPDALDRIEQWIATCPEPAGSRSEEEA